MLKWLRNNALGTYVVTRWYGELAGEDEYGNLYYRDRRGRDWSVERRWVVYAAHNEVEASRCPPGWNAWLRHNREKTPTEEPPPVQRWEKGHQANLSGTPYAYLPPGHELRGGQRDRATGDYEAWRP